MEIKIKINDEFLKEFKENDFTYCYASYDDEFRMKWKEQLNLLIDFGLIYHNNNHSSGSYIRYGLTALGIKYLTKLNELKTK